MGAFANDPQVKAQALSALADEEAPSILRVLGSASQLEEWATTVDLSPALVLLVAHLARGEDGREFLHQWLEAIAPGEDVTAAPHRWALWAWDDAPQPLRAAMVHPDALAAGAAAMELHQRAIRRKPVGRQEWRVARAALGRLGDGETDAAFAASVLAAGCWDFDSVPGAAADMADAWERMVMASVRRGEGWGTAQMAEVQRIIQEQHAIAEARLGPEPADEDATARRKRVTSAILSQLAELDNPLLHRNAHVNEQLRLGVARLREAGRSALIERVGPMLMASDLNAILP